MTGTEEPERLILDFAAAAVAGHAAEFFDRVAHPLYVFVGADGRREGRQPHLEGWRDLQAVRRYTSVTPTDLTISEVGGSAVATFYERVQGEHPGQAFDRTFLWSAHFVRDGGRWQLLAEHATLVPQGENP